MPTLEQVQAEVSRTGGNWAEAARNLGVHYQTLQKAMRKQGFGRKQPFAEKGTRPGIRYETVGYGGQYHRLPPREATVLKAVKEHRTTDAAALSQLLGLEPRKIQMAMETLRRRRGIPVRPEKGTMTVTATIEGRKVITAITEEKLARLRDRVLSGRLPMHLLRMELRKKLKETYPEIRKALKEGKISESG
jgi:transposase-like protein